MACGGLVPFIFRACQEGDPPGAKSVGAFRGALGMVPRPSLKAPPASLVPLGGLYIYKYTNVQIYKYLRYCNNCH